MDRSPAAITTSYYYKNRYITIDDFQKSLKIPQNTSFLPIAASQKRTTMPFRQGGGIDDCRLTNENLTVKNIQFTINHSIAIIIQHG
jgi:hypothetical protein